MRVGWALAITAVVLAMGLPVSAVEFRSDDTVSVPSGTTIRDDLYAFGQNVSIAGTVIGDILAAGSEVGITGTATQDITVAGGNVVVGGSAGDDLLAAAGTLRVTGTVAQNATITGGQVTLTDTSRVARDLVVAAGTLVANGAVGRNVYISAGEAEINGTVGGDVRFQGSNLRIGSRSVIRGDLVYTSPTRAEIAPGARILGETTYREAPRRERGLAPLFAIAWWLVTFFSLLIIGLLLIALAPRMVAAAADRIISDPWISLLIGFLILVAVPVLVFVIAATVVGFPLAMILLFVYLVSIYISRIFVGMAIGRALFRATGRSGVSMYLQFAAGLLLLWIALAIPIIGWLANIAAILFGLGALYSERYSMVRDLRREGRM